MVINTKFNLGDKVWGIQTLTKQEFSKCKACNGKGKIDLLDGDTYSCPKCHFGTVSTWTKLEWRVDDCFPSVIGKIEARIYSYSKYGENENRYMIICTGIGTGQVWDEKDLFGSHEAALLECEKRNMKQEDIDEQINCDYRLQGMCP
jgi:hypothetical protein